MFENVLLISDNNYKYFTLKIVHITSGNIKSFSEQPGLKVWHVMLTLGFVKGTNTYV